MCFRKQKLACHDLTMSFSPYGIIHQKNMLKTQSPNPCTIGMECKGKYNEKIKELSLLKMREDPSSPSPQSIYFRKLINSFRLKCGNIFLKAKQPLTTFYENVFLKEVGTISLKCNLKGRYAPICQSLVGKSLTQQEPSFKMLTYLLSQRCEKFISL